MFATGIENSYPTIDGGRVRVDEMAKCGTTSTGAPTSTASRISARTCCATARRCIAPGSVPAATTGSSPTSPFAELLRRDITPMVDLCHFGVPDWIGNFQNPDFPKLFAEYARAFAERFRWVQLYTPVNEMFVCAVFSAGYGWWNEQLSAIAASSPR
jgi:hypothetical protein